jgi:hypothetical protein
MQEEMNERFVPRINRFIELLKEARQMHAAHIMRLKNWQIELKRENNLLINQLKTEIEEETYIADKELIYTKMLNNLTYCKDFEKYVNSFRGTFQEYIDDLNVGLGTLSNHWGGYIETLGVQYMLHTLRNAFGVHTSFQKFERSWHKDKKKVEIDLLALSDTHAYVVEVKSQLREDTFTQMLYILDKIYNKIPEYNHLKIQPVFVCTYAEEAIVHSTTLSGLWIVRYNDFTLDNPRQNFEWLRKDV